MIVSEIYKPGWFVEVYPTKGVMDTYCRGTIIRLSEHWVWVEFAGSQKGGRAFRRDTGLPVYAQDTSFPCYAIRKVTTKTP